MMRTILLEYLRTTFAHRYVRGGAYAFGVGLLTMVAYAAINASNPVTVPPSTAQSTTPVTTVSGHIASTPLISSQSSQISASSAVTASVPSGVQYTTDRHFGRSATTMTSSPTTAPHISYHGGLVLKGTTNVYLIWYGNWSQTATAKNTTPSIISDFVKNVGVSSMINTNMSYGAATRVTLAAQVYDGYSQGTALTQQGVANIVNRAVNNNTVPADPNGVYLVLSSADVSETQPDGSSFGQPGGFCAWHSYEITNANINLHVGFVGDPTYNISGCAGDNVYASPNNNPAADAMVNSVAHEMEETITDPEFTGWYFSDGSAFDQGEMADACSYMFGQTYPVANNVNANLSLGTRNYLVQQTWNAWQQTCTFGQYNTNTLLPGQILYANNRLTSPDGQYVLVMQPDGNLVEYKNGLATWSSSTNRASSNNRAVMQPDGNLVIYNGSTPLWTSNSAGKPQSILALQNDGNLVVYQTAITWSSNASRSAPSSGTSLVIGSGTGTLTPNTQLWSGNGLFKAVMQTDGNFVVYSQTSGSALWATSFGGGGWGTVMSAGGSAVFQNDGNFVLYSPTGSAYWASNTAGGPSGYLSFEDSGLLNVHSPQTVTWASSWHTTNNLL